jgi:hypothetical protein
MNAWSDGVSYAGIGAVIVLFVLVFGRGFRVKWGNASAELDAARVADRLDSIDKAVNSRPAGSTTVSDDITRLVEKMDDLVNRMTTVEHLSEKTAARVGALEHPEEAA